MTKLLSINADAKTIKGNKKGYLTAIQYLSPIRIAGLTCAPMQTTHNVILHV